MFCGHIVDICYIPPRLHADITEYRGKFRQKFQADGGVCLLVSRFFNYFLGERGNMRNVRVWRNFALVLAAAGLIGGCSLITEDMAQILEVKNPAIEARKKVMRGLGGNMKLIKIALKAGGGVGPLRQIKWRADDIAKLARKISGAFQKETLGGKTRATSKIWRTKSGFDQIASNLALSAQLLASSAADGDMGGIKNTAKTVGANCGKCHKSYRVNKKKAKKNTT